MCQHNKCWYSAFFLLFLKITNAFVRGCVPQCSENVRYENNFLSFQFHFSFNSRTIWNWLYRTLAYMYYIEPMMDRMNKQWKNHNWKRWKKLTIIKEHLIKSQFISIYYFVDNSTLMTTIPSIYETRSTEICSTSTTYRKWWDIFVI